VTGLKQKIVKRFGGIMQTQDQKVKEQLPPPGPEDWWAYDQLKRRIREIYPPVEAERMINRLLDIVKL
jgi:hypothetical protein